MIDLNEYFKGSAVKELIRKITPDDLTSKEQIWSDLEQSFDDNKWYKGSDVVLLLQTFVAIIYEEGDKAIVEISEESVKKAVAPILGDVAALNAKIDIMSGETDLMKKIAWLGCGIAVGIVVKTVLDSLFNRDGG